MPLNPIGPEQVSIIDDSISKVSSKLELCGLKAKRIFLTGGTGFFGLWILSFLRHLNQRGFAIEVCALSRNPELFLGRYPHFRQENWLTFVFGDIKEFNIPDENFDLAIHAATETSLAAHSAPKRMFDDIVLGTQRLLKLAEICSVKRVLLISSGAVYGQQPETMTHQPDDSQLACNPLVSGNAYGEGKRVMELMGAMLQKDSGIECISARCYTFCGPGLPLDGHYAFGNFVRDALYRDEILVNSDGSSMRSYLYGADLAAWLLNLLIHGEAGQAYNVGNDEAISITELAFRVRDVLAPRKNVRILKNEASSGVSRHFYVPCISKARQLGCAPWTTLEEGLRMSAKFWQG